MSELSDGTYLLTDVQWRREDREEPFRPLHGMTTGYLTVRGGTVHAEARFNDQFLSNRFSDLEEEEIPITLIVAVIETEDQYLVSCSAPTLDRAGASYKLKADGNLRTLDDERAVA